MQTGRIRSCVFGGSAIGMLAFAVALAAQAPDALQRARSLLEHGQAAEAGHTLEGFLQQHPRNADGWTLLGVARAQQHEPARRRSASIRRFPSNRISHRLRPISVICC